MAESGSPAREPTSGVMAAGGRISLSRKLEVWDQSFVRVRLDLGLPSHGSQVEYLLDVYLYLPGDLDVNKFTLPREDFYKELHTYLSLESPDMRVEHLTSSREPESPLRRVLDMHSRIATGAVRPEAIQVALEEEIKVAGCLAHTWLRDSLDGFRKALAAPADDPVAEARLEADLGAFAAHAARIPAAYREVQAMLLAAEPRLPGLVDRALRDVDEYISHQTGKVLSRLVVLLEERRPGLAGRIGPGLIGIMRGERSYREAAGFHLGSSVGAQDGSFLRHIELLEAAVESAMFLNQRREIGMEWYGDWIGAFAAAVAMVFAFLAAYLVGGSAPGKLDLSVMTAAVIAYAFKDRIKDVIKRKLVSDSRGWFPDLDTRILDRETGAVIGRSFETTRWMSPATVPPEVEAVRSKRSLTRSERREATGESVLRYSKRMFLDPERVYEAHHRRGHVIETLSLGLKRFLRAARPPQVDLLALTPAGDAVRHVLAHRQYVLNLVVRYGVPGAGELYEKIRVFADQNGPVRVETVIPPCRPEDVDKLEHAEASADWVRPPGPGHPPA